MNVEVILPKLGFSMSEGEIQEWLVHDGGEVKEGEPLYVIESDKSAQELESPGTGILRIKKEAGGGPYPVGTVLATIE